MLQWGIVPTLHSRQGCMKNDLSRKSQNSTPKEELLLLCPCPSPLSDFWETSLGKEHRILPEGRLMHEQICTLSCITCMNRYAHCHVLVSWQKASAEGAVKQFCHGNIILILLEMPSGCPLEIVLGQVWKCCLVCQVHPCLWQLYFPWHGKRFLKTTVPTGILIYSCSTHLKQIQDLL